MTAIGSGSAALSSSTSAWQNLQTWQAKMKAANQQFQNNASQFTDTLFSGPTSESQSLGDLVTQEASNRIAQQSLGAVDGGTMASSPDDVYRGDSADATTDPFASTSPAGGSNPDVYWGVDPSSPVSASSSTPAMGSSSDSYWGTPSVDLTV